LMKNCSLAYFIILLTLMRELTLVDIYPHLIKWYTHFIVLRLINREKVGQLVFKKSPNILAVYRHYKNMREKKKPENNMLKVKR
jgi:hypothetical protein